MDPLKVMDPTWTQRGKRRPLQSPAAAAAAAPFVGYGEETWITRSGKKTGANFPPFLPGKLENSQHLPPFFFLFNSGLRNFNPRLSNFPLNEEIMHLNLDFPSFVRINCGKRIFGLGDEEGWGAAFGCII